MAVHSTLPGQIGTGKKKNGGLELPEKLHSYGEMGVFIEDSGLG